MKKFFISLFTALTVFTAAPVYAEFTEADAQAISNIFKQMNYQGGMAHVAANMRPRTTDTPVECASMQEIIDTNAKAASPSVIVKNQKQVDDIVRALAGAPVPNLTELVIYIEPTLDGQKQKGQVWLALFFDHCFVKFVVEDAEDVQKALAVAGVSVG